MKNYLFIAAAVVLLSSCNQKELTDANRERDSLISIVNERDSFLNLFITSINDVELNLDSVAVKQHIIVMNTEKAREIHPTQRSRINAEIKAINKLMDENRMQIAELSHKIKASKNKSVQLEKMIANLQGQITRKDAELAELNLKLNSLDAQVATLNTSVDELKEVNGVQSQTIDEATTALHTAYFIVGKSNDLKDAKIIDTKGGLLGIGKTSKLNGDFNNSEFTRIDYTQTLSIDINSDMKIITSHPTGSYTLVKDAKDKDLVKNIIITNPEIFWSASKYLVVVKD